MSAFSSLRLTKTARCFLQKKLTKHESARKIAKAARMEAVVPEAQNATPAEATPTDATTDVSWTPRGGWSRVG